MDIISIEANLINVVKKMMTMVLNFSAGAKHIEDSHHKIL